MSVNVFEAFAKLTLDSKEYDQGLKDAGGKLNSFGATLMKGIGGVAAGVGAAIGAAATGVAALTKSAVDGYAEYEQLTGGVETLFKDSAGTVIEYANNAYKTAGLSANEYMETVTSFSASLLQSVGGDTAAAAGYADKAITDMSDNANKMGTDMSAIQNAYQGFAKQNYTMLDNLKLGYGGTKTEMERLVLDAEALNSSFKANRDANGDLAMSYADIVDAIHIVQDNMGITGTTALEASETISGSIGQMKSAWDNLVVGLADNEADLDKLINNVISAGETALENLMPTIETAITSIGNAVEKIAPVIAEKLPPLVNRLLPSILKAATSLVNGLVKALPAILQVVIDVAPTVINSIIDTALGMLPEIIRLGLELVLTLAEGIANSLPELIPAVVKAIMQIVKTLTEPSSLERIITAALEIILGLAKGLIKALPEIIRTAPEIIRNLVQALVAEIPQILAAAMELIQWLAVGIIEAIPELLVAAGEIIVAIVGGIANGMMDVVDAGRDIVKNLWDGISGAWDWLVTKVKDLFGGLLDNVKGLLGISSPSKVFAGIGENLALGLGEGYEDAMRSVAQDIQQISNEAIPTINAPLVDMFGNSYYDATNPRGTMNNFSGGINIYVDSHGMDVSEVADELGTAFYRKVRMTGAVL